MTYVDIRPHSKAIQKTDYAAERTHHGGAAQSRREISGHHPETQIRYAASHASPSSAIPSAAPPASPSAVVNTTRFADVKAGYCCGAGDVKRIPVVVMGQSRISGASDGLVLPE